MFRRGSRSESKNDDSDDDDEMSLRSHISCRLMKRANDLANEIRKPLVELQEMIAFRAFLHREMCEKASHEDFKSCLALQGRRDFVTKRAHEMLRTNRLEIEAALRPCPPVDVRAEMIENLSIRVKFRLGPTNLNGDVVTACTILLYPFQGWKRRAEDGRWLADYDGKNICNSASATLLLGLERCGMMMKDSIEPVHSLCVALDSSNKKRNRSNPVPVARLKFDEALPYYECVIPLRDVSKYPALVAVVRSHAAGGPVDVSMSSSSLSSRIYMVTKQKYSFLRCVYR